MFAVVGLVPYNVTALGIIGAVVVVIGVVLVLAKPSEMFSLRNIDD